MITGEMTDAEGMEISFAAYKDLDIEAREWLVLRIGGRRAARLDTEQQQEFLRHFRDAQLAAGAPPEDL